VSEQDQQLFMLTWGLAEGEVTLEEMVLAMHIGHF
jgi:hypothetical protein